jgi:hypothetical protein
MEASANGYEWMNLPETIHFDFDPQTSIDFGGPQVMSLPSDMRPIRAGFRANQFNSQNK